MDLLVVSHKLCWPLADSPTGYGTDGGFPFQIEALAGLFDKTTIVVPTEESVVGGLAPLKGRGVMVLGISVPKGSGIRRKLKFPFWFLRNGLTIWRAVRKADAVHTPIPGDVGTIGLLFALALRKPLFVRHCGNWLVQRTVAERFWKWIMVRFAGGRNVMLATGGSPEPPSRRNKNVRWIFSTSLRSAQIGISRPRKLPEDGGLRIAIACRQEPRKGTDVLIRSFPLIRKSFPGVTLDIVGDGSKLASFKQLAKKGGQEEFIRFHGRLKHDDVLEVLKQSDLFCFPTSASEGFPKAVLEALATGLPVVTTPVSVLPELVGSGAGVVIDSPCPESIAKAVRVICSDRTLYNEMSANAIETARRYSLEEWQRQIGLILRESWQMPTASPKLRSSELEIT